MAEKGKLGGFVFIRKGHGDGEYIIKYKGKDKVRGAAAAQRQAWAIAKENGASVVNLTGIDPNRWPDGADEAGEEDDA